MRLARTALIAWHRYRRRRERGCVRCGAPAAGVCLACQARICAGCSVLSIETGTPAALCLGCSGSPMPAARMRPSAWRLFRRGASLLLLVLAAVFSVSVARDGWGEAARVVFVLLHPSILFALVPLALVLGAAITLLRKLIGENTESAR